MSSFESTLATALRDEAREIAMSTDLNDGLDVLENRLDDVDRSRRNRWVAAGVAALAAVAAVVAVVSLTRAPTTDTPVPPATPAPSASTTFSSSVFATPFKLRLPDWVLQNVTVPFDDSESGAYWQYCPNDQNCIGLDVTRYQTVVTDAGFSGPAVTSYAAYLAYLDGLKAKGYIDITDRRQTTVAGRPATVLTIQANDSAPKGSMGCDVRAVCSDFLGWGHYVVVDLGAGAPMSIWSRTGNRPDWVQQMDDVVLPSFRLLQGRTFSSSTFALPFSAVLPAWTSDVASLDARDTAGAAWWQGTWCTASCTDADMFDLAYLLPTAVGAPSGQQGSTAVPTAKAYDAYLRSLASSGAITLSSTSAKVGGVAGTDYTVTPARTIPAGLSCQDQSTTSCWDLREGATLRVVALDVQGRLVLVANMAHTGSPHRIATQVQFLEMLATVRFR